MLTSARHLPLTTSSAAVDPACTTSCAAPSHRVALLLVTYCNASGVRRIIGGNRMWSRACLKLSPCLSPFGFVFAEATVPRLSCCKGEVGIVPSLRPAENWGEDEVSLKRRHITGSHVGHVTEACGSGSYVRVYTT